MNNIIIKYLTEEQAISYLNLAKSIEQWLSYYAENDAIILRWLKINKESTEEYSVAYYESFDDGNSDFADVYEFSAKDPDEPDGTLNTFHSVEEALSFTEMKYGAKRDKYIPAGMIQEEYLNYIHSFKNE
jgi:hypothetical protein